MATATRTEPSTPPRAERRRGRVLRGIGKTLIAAGVLVLLFVAYELWGTDFVTKRYQSTLRADVGDRGFSLRPIPGDAAGYIRIPKIDLDMVFVEGTGVEELKKGPGHYSDTPMPGAKGNVGIAGHRTTYARPFWDLQKLQRGDDVILETRRGWFRYRVQWQRIVGPTDYWVLEETKRPAVTLTTCHPRFSAAQRLVVRAVLVESRLRPLRS